jgi:lipopolysaccharide biosynthesis glycosyltransferase
MERLKEVIQFGKNKDEGKIRIAYGVDENYLRYVLVSMTSVIQHNKSVSFYLAMDDISDAAKIILDEFANKYNVVIILYLINKDCLKEWPLKHKELSLATYYRFFLFDSIENGKYVLYLDADVICVRSLDCLSDINLGERILAAVPDLERMNEQKKKLALSKDHIYFNAGVLLVNLQQWRSHGCLKKILKVLSERDGNLDYEDQDILNIIFDNKVRYLPVEFNVIKINGRSLSDCRLIHFASNPKPWNKYWCLNPQCNDWSNPIYKYYENECFKDEKREPADFYYIVKWIVKRLFYSMISGVKQYDADSYK